jgi:hypothetical protein
MALLCQLHVATATVVVVRPSAAAPANPIEAANKKKQAIDLEWRAHIATGFLIHTSRTMNYF